MYNLMVGGPLSPVICGGAMASSLEPHNDGGQHVSGKMAAAAAAFILTI